jgi:hypothetical protein
VTENPTKVFISYSWDSEEHKEKVLRLANTLRNPWGIETDLDHYVRAKPPYTPAQGWDIWMERKIEWAEFVLIVCTETYKRRFRGDEEPGIGRGVTWEGTIIRQNLYNKQLRDTKFIPVVFSAQDWDHVPTILDGRDKYIIEDPRSFKELCYRLRKEPTVAIPEVARAKLPPPPEPKFLPQNEPPAVFLDVPELQEVDSSPRKDSESTHAIDAVPLESEQGVDYRHLQDLLKAGKWREAGVFLNIAELQALYSSPRKNSEPTYAIDAVVLESELRMNYCNLRDLLKAGKWREADRETLNTMLEFVNRKIIPLLNRDNLNDFPCKDLRTIDRLWLAASNGHFGFSVQKKIWEECGSPTTYNKNWEKFGDRVGWRKNDNWLNYKDLKFSIDSSLCGELPALGTTGFGGFLGPGVWSNMDGVFSRAKTCNL